MNGAPLRLAVVPATDPVGHAEWVGGPQRLTGSGEGPGTDHRLILPAATTDILAGAFVWSGQTTSVHRDDAGRSSGLVLGLLDIAEGVENEFEDWYETEHLPRLAAVPGVLYAARFRGDADSSPRYLAMYRTADLAISQSSAWMAAARTPWSARMRRFTTQYRRYAFFRQDQSVADT